jgi:hypothetical protein
MAHLIVDTQRNLAFIKEGEVCRFNRRWESHILALLLQAATLSQTLCTSDINQALQLHGQARPLNRAQLQRLFQNLSQFLSCLPNQPIQISTPPRKATVGPWSLVFQSPVSFEICGAQNAQQNQPTFLLAPSIDELHQVLTSLLISDGFAVHGDYRNAIEAIQLLYTQNLTPEARCMAWLREALWQKRLGHFETARSLTRRVVATATPADPGLQSHAHFFLHRIAYDNSPAEAAHLLWDVASLPAPILSADWRTQAEWHNLRALLARRRLHALAHAQPAQPISSAETPESLSRSALLHFESALYLGAWQRDWDRLQAYVANLAYHLQSVFSLKLPWCANISQVFSWYRLTLAYGEKLEAARDSAWEYIFLGTFWLDHHAELIFANSSDALAQEVDGSNPANEIFYLRAINRLRDCGDVRQIAIGYTLYMRFAKNHMRGPAKLIALQTACAELATLLTNQPPTLLQTLRDEGYAAHWPTELKATA